MKLAKKISQILLIALAMAVGPSLALGGSAGAASSTEVVQLQGTFHTQTLFCPDDPTNPECFIDGYTSGPLQPGTYRLETLVRDESDPVWNYRDKVTINGPFGTFVGEERGFVVVDAGKFVGTATLTSTDGCGSTIHLVNNGTIDLNTFEDDGTYTGVLIKKTC